MPSHSDGCGRRGSAEALPPSDTRSEGAWAVLSWLCSARLWPASLVAGIRGEDDASYPSMIVRDSQDGSGFARSSDFVAAPSIYSAHARLSTDVRARSRRSWRSRAGGPQFVGEDVEQFVRVSGVTRPSACEHAPV